jgi:hypothetical protein
LSFLWLQFISAIFLSKIACQAQEWPKSLKRKEIEW